MLRDCFRTFQIFLYSLFLTPAVALAQEPHDAGPTYGWGWNWFWGVALVVMAFLLVGWIMARGRRGRRTVL